MTLQSGENIECNVSMCSRTLSERASSLQLFLRTSAKSGCLITVSEQTPFLSKPVVNHRTSSTKGAPEK